MVSSNHIFLCLSVHCSLSSVIFFQTSSLLKVMITFLDSYCCFPCSSAGKEFTCNAADRCSIPGSGKSPGEGIGYPLQDSWASLVAQLVKNLPTLQKLGFDPWVGKIPWRTERVLSPVCWPGEFYELHSPWDCKELEMTE